VEATTKGGGGDVPKTVFHHSFNEKGRRMRLAHPGFARSDKLTEKRGKKNRREGRKKGNERSTRL